LQYASTVIPSLQAKHSAECSEQQADVGAGVGFGSGVDFGAGVAFGSGVDFGAGVAFGSGLDFGAGVAFGLQDREQDRSQN